MCACERDCEALSLDTKLNSGRVCRCMGVRETVCARLPTPTRTCTRARARTRARTLSLSHTGSGTTKHPESAAVKLNSAAVELNTAKLNTGSGTSKHRESAAVLNRTLQKLVTPASVLN